MSTLQERFDPTIAALLSSTRREFPVELIERLKRDEQFCVDVHDMAWLLLEAMWNARVLAGHGAETLLDVSRMLTEDTYAEWTVNLSGEMIHPDRVLSRMRDALFLQPLGSSGDNLASMSVLGTFIPVTKYLEGFGAFLPILRQLVSMSAERSQKLDFVVNPAIADKLGKGFTGILGSIDHELRCREKYEQICSQ